MAPSYTTENISSGEAISGGQLPADATASALDANPGFRDAMIAALPSYAVAEKVPPERYEAWRAERLAKIDKDTGYVAPDPAVAAEAARAEAHAVAPAAKPDDFNVIWNADFISGSKDIGKTTAELREFAAALKLTPEIGKSLLERLAVLAPRFKDMGEKSATNYRLDQENALRRFAGSQEAADAKLASARKALEIAGDNKLAAALSQSLQLLDLEILVTLASHGERWDAYSKKGKP